MRNNELMKLKQEENDTRIRNLQLKRLQIAEEHKKLVCVLSVCVVCVCVCVWSLS